MGVDGGAQVFDSVVVEVGAPRFQSWRRIRTLGGTRRAVGLPRAVERVELDMGDRFAPVVPAIDRALDDVAQLANVARPWIGVELLPDVAGETRPGLPT